MATKNSTAIFIGVAAALLATCFGGGYYLLNHYGREFMTTGKEVFAEARTFAVNSDNAACVTEANARYTTESEIKGALKGMMFLTACLKESKPTPGFCDDVPSPRDVMKSQPWQREQCAKPMMGKVRCPMVMGAIQQHCHPMNG